MKKFIFHILKFFPSTSEINLKKRKCQKIKIFKNLFKYRSEVRDFLEKTQPDIIHIHGLWRPIHLFFVFITSNEHSNNYSTTWNVT